MRARLSKTCLKSNSAPSWLLSRPNQDLTDERFGGLSHKHLDHVRHILRLEHLGFVLALVGTQIRVHRSRAYDRNSDAKGSQLFRCGVAQPIQAPFGSGIGGTL